MIQALRFLLGFCGNTLWYGGKVILGALVGVKHRPGGFYDQAQRGWGSGMLRATRIEVQPAGPGWGRLDQSPRVYISNHASFVDIWALLQELPGSLRFVFKKGPFVLAIAAQAPVVPIFCEHTYALLPKGTIAPRRGTVVLHVGQEISTKGMSYEDREGLSEQCRRAILALGAKE